MSYSLPANITLSNTYLLFQHCITTLNIVNFSCINMLLHHKTHGHKGALQNVAPLHSKLCIISYLQIVNALRLRIIIIQLLYFQHYAF